jgi:hypothetical protein
MGAFSKPGFRTERAFAGILITKCFAMATDLLDHVQALHSPPPPPKSPLVACDFFVTRWRITPVPLG